MLDIKKIPVNMLEENCYVVSDDTREAVVIDCGALTDDDRRRITDYLTEGDDISFGHHTLTVLSTPGHTPGGICFYCAAEKAVFVGDTLFYCSVGRTDFPGGDSEALCESVRNKLFTLPEDTRVYPGHGPYTEVGFEKAHNPYIG